MKDCHTCMYATHTHGTRKMGQNVIVTNSNSITCTREKVGSIVIDDDGMHCSDYAPAIEGEMDEGKTCREQLIEELHKDEMRAFARRDYEYACIVSNLQDLLKEEHGNDTARSESSV